MSSSSPEYEKHFAPVHVYELKQVVERRRAFLDDPASTPALPPEGPTPPTLEEVRRCAHRMDLFGVAFSGGGIRSGTFALGILQALASLKLLPRVDYLSTVSGGGYVGGWLAAWIRRETEAAKLPRDLSADASAAGRVGVENVQHQLDPSRIVQGAAERHFPVAPAPTERVTQRVVDEEPEPVRHLRSYSRYLTPQAGLFSLDTWSLFAIYLRNTVMNLLVTLPLVVCAILVMRWLVVPFSTDWDRGLGRFVTLPSWAKLVFWLTGILAPLAVAYLFMRHQVSRVRAAASPDWLPDTTGSYPDPAAANSGGAWRFVVAVCLVVSAGFALYVFGQDYPINPTHSRISAPLSGLTASTGSRKAQEGASSVENTCDLGAAMSSLWGHLGNGWEYIGPWWRAAVLYGLLGLLVALIALGIEFRNNPRGIRGWRRRLLATTLFGATAGLLAWLVIHVLNFREGMTYDPLAVVAFGPPLYLVAVTIASYVEVAVSGPYMGEPEREWRSRLGAYLLRWSAAWAVVSATIFYLPDLLLSGDWWSAAVWAVGAAGTYLGRRAPAGENVGPGGKALQWLVTIAPAVTLIGLVGALSLGVGYLLNDRTWLRGPQPPFWRSVLDQNGWVVASAAAGSFALGSFFSSIVLVNTFSLHMLYANRLTRCYLGASRNNHRWKDRGEDWGWHREGPTGAPTGVPPPPRSANEFTDFDARDDLPLVKLRLTDVPLVDRREQAHPGTAGRGYYGPYPLFNATLNLVGASALAEQDRKGESFVLTPDYCGTLRTGYARMPDASAKVDNAVWENLTVGRAVTISGAAVDPNMRFYQSASLTILLSLLNLRLGWWVKNPDPEMDRWPWEKARPGPWVAATPGSGRLLYNELAGGTRANGPYVHLSDGGHFENTGAYELIRRRCRFVVVVDAGTDALDASENLANLVRLVRTDFGIRVDIDTAPLHKDADGLSRAHAAVGVIHYDDVDDGGVNGTLVFIRASMTGDEPPDVKNYAANNPPFPHHSTLDQFFEEDQFESYRALGYHVGREVFAEAAGEAERQRAGGRYNRELFAELRRAWSQVTTAQFEQYTSALGPWTDMEEVLRTDARAVGLNLDMFPELVAALRADVRGRSGGLSRATGSELPDPRGWGLADVGPAAHEWLHEAGRDRVTELRVVSQLVGMMETAWMEMDLNRTHATPLQRGWMSCLRRWTAAPKFQTYWPIFRPQYSWGFVRFCERVLNVVPPAPTAVRWDALPDDATRDEIVRELGDEFRREWALVLNGDPGSGWEPNYLPAVAADAKLTVLPRRPTLWALTYGPPGAAPTADGSWKDGEEGLPSFPIGIVAVRKWLADDGGGRGSSGDAYSELLFWVRGAYRTAEAGRALLPVILDVLRREDAAARALRQVFRLGPDPTPQYLLVRYPRTGTTAAESQQRARWTTFFNDHDFVSYRLRSEVARREVRLRWRL